MHTVKESKKNRNRALPQHSTAQDHQLVVNYDSYVLFLVKNTSRCRMDVPSSSKHDTASVSFFDPGHETQLQREVFFTNQNVYFFMIFSQNVYVNA